jgi:hypothetical protein
MKVVFKMPNRARPGSHCGLRECGPVAQNPARSVRQTRTTDRTHRS